MIDNLFNDRIGEKFTTHNGYEIEIIEYFNNKNCTVEFKEGGYIVRNKSYSQILSGFIKIPKESKIGEKYTTNEGYIIEITKYVDKTNCTIKFEDGSIIRNRYYKDVQRGHIKNPYHKSVYSVGFLGKGKYSAKRGCKIYTTWRNMLRRCYNEKHQLMQPTYKNVVVCEEWHNFQNYAKWYKQNYKISFQIDKDILIKGNKIYSPETCCFVPQEINNLFTNRKNKRKNLLIGIKKCKNGCKARVRVNNTEIDLGFFNTPEEAFQAYKTAKEAYIKEVADRWRGKITEPTYEAMYKYEVEITD